MKPRTSPIVITDDVSMAASAQGGPASVTALAQVLFSALGENKSVKDSVTAPRMHSHTMPSEEVVLEGGMLAFVKPYLAFVKPFVNPFVKAFLALVTLYLAYAQPYLAVVKPYLAFVKAYKSFRRKNNCNQDLFGEII